MSHEFGPQQEQEIPQRDVYTVADLPVVYTLEGKPDVKLMLGAIKQIVPEHMRDQIWINVKALAQLAHFGGLEQVGIQIDESKDETGIALGSVSGGAGAGTHVYAARREATAAQVESYDGEWEPHAARWGRGQVILSKQDMHDVLEKKGARNVEAVGELLNKQLYKGITQLGMDSLKEKNDIDKTFTIYTNFMSIISLVAPLPHGGSFIMGPSGQLGGVLGEFGIPGSLPELFIRLLVTYGVVSLGLNALAHKTSGDVRICLIPTDSEPYRRGLIKAFQTISRIPQFRNRYPLAQGNSSL